MITRYTVDELDSIETEESGRCKEVAVMEWYSVKV